MATRRERPELIPRFLGRQWWAVSSPNSAPVSRTNLWCRSLEHRRHLGSMSTFGRLQRRQKAEFIVGRVSRAPNGLVRSAAPAPTANDLPDGRLSTAFPPPGSDVQNRRTFNGDEGSSDIIPRPGDRPNWLGCPTQLASILGFFSSSSFMLREPPPASVGSTVQVGDFQTARTGATDPISRFRLSLRHRSWWVAPLSTHQRSTILSLYQLEQPPSPGSMWHTGVFV